MWELELKHVLPSRFEYVCFEAVCLWAIVFHCTHLLIIYLGNSMVLEVWLKFSFISISCFQSQFSNLLFCRVNKRLWVSFLLNPQETQLLLLGMPRGLKACCMRSMQSSYLRKWSNKLLVLFLSLFSFCFTRGLVKSRFGGIWSVHNYISFCTLLTYDLVMFLS